MPRWVGTVRADGQVLSWSSLDVAGSVRAHWLVRGNFELELEDGRTLHVDASNRELDIQPVTERRDRWSDLESLPECRMFRATGPAPHSKVTLRTCSISGGDRVTVVGSVIQETFEPGSDHRSAPEKHPTHVRAERVAQGDVEEEAKRSPKKKPGRVDRSRFGIARGTYVLGAITAIGFVLGAWSWSVTGLGSRAVDLIIFGFGGITATALWQFHVSHPVGFIHRDKYVDLRPGWSFLGFAYVFWLIMMTLSLFWDGEMAEGHLVNNQGVVTWASIGVAALGVGWVLVTSFRTLRLIDVITKAEPLAGIAVGAWGRIVGTVHDPTPVLGGEAAMAAKRELEWTDGSGSHDLEMATYNQDSFFVRTDDGEVEIEAGQGTWATDVRRFPEWRGFAGMRVPVDGRLLLSTELIPQGAKIVVAGRIMAGDPFVMKSTGPESLVFFATRPDGDPVASLRRARLVRIVVVALCLVCGAASWSLAEATRGDLPERREYIPGD